MKNRKTSGFTLIELLTVIAIIGILATLIIPSLSKSKEYAQAAICMNNLRQVAIGFQNYCQDSENQLPLVEYWLDDFAPIYRYVGKDNDIFICPKTRNVASNIWDVDGNLRDGDFLRGGTLTDVEKNFNSNAGHGNNAYHFDISNPSPNTQAVVASKRSTRIVYERYWGSHFNGMFFNVVYMDDCHAEREKNGQSAYWMLDDRDWIQTDLNPYPENSRVFDTDNIDGGNPPSGGGGGLGDCTFCGGDGVKDNGTSCNKCGGDGWL